MTRNPIIKIDGKTYMDTKAAAGYWGVRASTVASYCKNGDVPGAYKDHSGKWSIPIDAIKPFSKEDIKKILRLTVQLQNNPDFDIDYAALGIASDQLPAVYHYLSQLQYIKPPKKIAPHRLPYEIQLTTRGIDLVTSDIDSAVKKETNIQDTLSTWGPLVINLITTIIKAS